MKRTLQRTTLLLTIVLSSAKNDLDLPLCPTNIQYFPQNLPMHCRLPQSSAATSDNDRESKLRAAPTFPPSIYQSPSPLRAPSPIPYPIPSAFPAPIYPPPAYPAPVPIMAGGPAHKLPVIVMPFYAPDRSYTKKPHTDSDTDKNHDSNDDADNDGTDTDPDTDTEDADSDGNHSGWWKPRKVKRIRSGRRLGGFTSQRRHHNHNHNRRRHNKRKDLLTPIIQYVTKDGYVIFEKEISKDEAKDWLNSNKNVNANEDSTTPSLNFDEENIHFDSGDNKVNDADSEDNAIDNEEKSIISLNEDPITTTTQMSQHNVKEKPKRSRQMNSVSKKRQPRETDVMTEIDVETKTIKL